MKRILFLSVIMGIFICGCATYPKLRVETPNIANPVSLSSVVSTNKKQEKNEIGHVTASASATESSSSYSTSGYSSERTSSGGSDNIETSIVSSLGGDENKAVKDLKIILLFGKETADIGYLNTSSESKSTIGRVEGTIVKVK
jgi:hypothetical protein